MAADPAHPADPTSPEPPEPMPARPDPWTLLTSFSTPGPRWPGALRAALALALPGAAALLLGFDNEMLLIAAGGFTVIYGEGHPYRTRWRVMAVAGGLIALASVSGAFVGSVAFSHLSAGAAHWWLALPAIFTALIATIGAFVQNALRLPAPGSFFIVMVGGGATMVARLGLNPVEVGAWSLVGALSAMVIGMAPALIHRHRPETQAVETLERTVAEFAAAPRPAVAKKHQAESALQTAWVSLSDAGVVRGGHVIDPARSELARRTVAAHRRLAGLDSRFAGTEQSEEMEDSPVYVDLERTAIPHARPTVAYRIYRSIHPYSHATMTATKVALASLLAGAIGLALQLDRPDWAVVSVLLTLQWGPSRVPGTIRGVQRLVGSVAGIGFFALLHATGVEGWSLLAVLAVCQFFAEIFVVRNYAFCVIFTTPLALLMGGAGTAPLGSVVVSRTTEVALAVTFALLMLWFWQPGAEPRHHARLVARCHKAMGSLLGALLTTNPAGALAERRDLQYELLSERRAAQTLVNDTPEAAEREWPRHVAIQQAGYALLDHCTRNDARELTLDDITELSRRVRASGD